MRSFALFVSAALLSCVDSYIAPPPPDTGAPTDGPVSTTDGGADAAPTLAVMTPTPALLIVPKGGMGSVDIKLARNGLAGQVNIVASNLPTGVTADIPPIASVDTATKLQLTAATSATIGDATVTLKAPGVADLILPVLVADSPGKLDTTFDNDGYATDTTTTTGVFFAAIVQPDGAIVAVGTSAFSGGKWLVRRFDKTGKVDTAFTAKLPTMPSAGTARAVALDPSKGRIVVAGDSGSLATNLIVMRFNADGSSDDGFANGGRLDGDMVRYSGSDARGVVVMSDSSIVIAGTKNNSYNRAFIDKYSSTGNLDSAFPGYSATNKSNLTGLVVTSSGALLATGTDSNASPPVVLAVRLTSSGSLDGSFAGGVRTYASGSRGYNLALTSDGQAVVPGTDVYGPSWVITSFDGTGSGNYNWNKGENGGLSGGFNAAAGGPSKSLYVAGHGGGTYDKFALLERRLDTGSFDTTFASGGTLTLEDPGTPDTYTFQFYALTTQPDGRVIVGGGRTGTTGGALLVRVWP